MSKKTYRIPLVWEMYGHLFVEAESLEEAIEHALGPDSPLPEGEYLSDSVQVDYDALKEFERDHRKNGLGDRVCCCDGEHDNSCGEIVQLRYDNEADLYCIHLDGSAEDEFIVLCDDEFFTVKEGEKV
jgi:hypothetical protein